jgi:hypothetical protein
LDLEKDLAVAQEELGQAQKRQESLCGLQAKFQARVDAAVSVVSAEMDEAVLKDREPKPSILKSLTDAQTKLGESQQLTIAAARVVQRAVDRVEEITGQIRAVAYETFIGAVGGQVNKVNEAFYRFVDEFAALQEALPQHGAGLQYNLGNLLFELNDQEYPWTIRHAKLQVLCALGNLLQSERGYTRAGLERPRFRRKG